jgi:hypothetical protein
VYESDPQTRALLRRAFAQLSASRDEPPPRSHRARFAALHVLLAEVSVLFLQYEIDAWTPMSNQPAFTFGSPGGLTVHVKPELADDVLRGMLRDQSPLGGPVRAVRVDIATLCWDPSLGRLVPADPAERRSALDVVTTELLRILRLQ